MIDQNFTTVWSSTAQYILPLRTATVFGTVVTVDCKNHNLSNGDDIDTRDGVFALETFGLLAAGRALIIINTEIAAEERFVG